MTAYDRFIVVGSTDRIVVTHPSLNPVPCDVFNVSPENKLVKGDLLTVSGFRGTPSRSAVSNSLTERSAVVGPNDV